MPYSAFTDKEHCPTMKEVFAKVGARKPLWETIIQFVEGNYGVKKADFGFYGKSYGWALRFRKGGKALISLYPGKENFTAQIIISPSDAKKAFDLSLGENTRKVLENAHKFHEGRWLFLKVESDQDVRDVQLLLTVKSRSQTK